ncbi:MAG: hypothetical protein H6573_13150 [Lewinellaceae bacterium]|nr:hypothetical protein [Phaeodactylibacter sp.]MCB0612138.1 hypothetical protein [Phaeodactylibacter sp.]MCB9348432.1 hypothetical protein [Lewinellaceae bacterium]
MLTPTFERSVERWTEWAGGCRFGDVRTQWEPCMYILPALDATAEQAGCTRLPNARPVASWTDTPALPVF